MNAAQLHEAEAETKRRRKRVTDTLARAERKELEDAFAALDHKPEFQPVRGPEIGLVMVRGRIGGGGSPFNLGEVTVTRATVRLSTGTIGHAYALGTDRKRASLAAVFEALAQEAEHREFVEKTILQPVIARLGSADRKKAEEAAATRVDFFTMVRGED